MTYLCPLSGGVDSTYCAWKLLTEGHRLILLHVNLVTSRWLQEKRATHYIVDWFKKNGLTNFEYHEVTHDPQNSPTRISDIEIVGFWTGALMRNREVDAVVVGSNAHDLVQGDSYDRRVERRAAILKAVTGKDVKLIRPAAELTKADIIAEMPADLFRLTWSCRRPRNKTACQECRACREVASGLPSA